MKKLLVATLAVAWICTARGAGFGIYEASSRGTAMGDAVLGDTSDATANYHNPANLAFTTNIMLSTGVSFINPYCDVEVEHVTQDRMNPGWFTVPTFFLSIPVTHGFVFGWGNYTEFGLGSHYNGRWDLAADTQKTTLRQVTLNPNLSYEITDWWSVSAGLRGSWIQFINHKHPYAHSDLKVDANGMGTLTAHDPFNLHSKLKGDDWSLGWSAATTVKPLKNVSVGLVYRSAIQHKIKGHMDLDGTVLGTASGMISHPLYGMIPYAAPVSQAFDVRARASAKLKLPPSLALGVNWDVTDRYRVGTVVTYTRWSSVHDINFKIDKGYSYTLPLHWRDTVRVGVGMEYDFTDWLSGRIGYTFDEDPSRKHNATTMLPAGDRHIIGAGVGFKITENLSLDLGYTFIRMNNQHYYVRTRSQDGSESRHYFSCHNGFSHIATATVNYSF